MAIVAGINAMEPAKHENLQSKIRQLVPQHLELLASDDEDAGVEGFEDLVKAHGWAACYGCLIEVLLDDNAGYKL